MRFIQSSILGCLGLSLIFCLFSCGPGFRSPLVASSELTEHKSLLFNAPEGRAVVYIFRPYQFVASGSPIPVVLDHNPAGSIPCNTYLYLEVMPRDHLIELGEYDGIKYYDDKSEKYVQVRRFPGSKTCSLRFTAEEGHCYFFTTKVKIGGFQIEQIEEKVGKTKIKKAVPSGDNRFDNAENLSKHSY